MAKPVSPLLGYNNNIRHKNRIFHIQTEDSGIKHPHIITHLFMDGGRILKSIKRSYAEFVGVEGMSEIVRGMMKEQHKSMFIALRDGQFDHLVEGGPAPSKAEPKIEAKAEAPSVAEPPREPAPAAVAKPASAPPPGARPPSVPPPAARPPSVPPPSSMASMPARPPSVPPAARPPSAPPPASARAAELAPLAARGLDQGVPSQVPITAKDPEPPPPAAPKSGRLVMVPEADEAPVTIPQPERKEAHPLAIDLDALERAAQAENSDAFFRTNDLPPPAKPMLEKTSSAYRALEAQTEVPLERRSVPPAPLPQGAKRPVVRPVSPGAARPSAAPPPAAARNSAPPPSQRRTSSGRYAPARPASIFSRQKPREGAVFDEGVVNDKTLDEVILSYLAEDLDGPPRKK